MHLSILFCQAFNLTVNNDLYATFGDNNSLLCFCYFIFIYLFFVLAFFKVAPENVALSTNLSATQRICAGMVVNFTCTVGASNPAIDTFTLYENISVVSSKRDSGVWIRALNNGGEVSYNCDVNNSVDTSSKGYVNFTVEGEATNVDIVILQVPQCVIAEKYPYHPHGGDLAYDPLPPLWDIQTFPHPLEIFLVEGNR